MTSVDVLYEGYVKEVDNGELVRNTVVLVRDNTIKMVVDPGLVESPNVIIESLGRFGLRIQDITHVYITHYHMDHVRYVGLFSEATILDYKSIYKGELWSEHDGDGHQISPDIQIVHTPGHTMDDSALLVKTDIGVVAISHIWWFDDRSPSEDPMAEDQALLEESRTKIEKLADWIVTPHSGMLRVK